MLSSANIDEINTVKLQFIDFISEFERLSELDKDIVVESICSVLEYKVRIVLSEFKDYI